jgi:hypothetical protein
MVVERDNSNHNVPSNWEERHNEGVNFRLSDIISLAVSPHSLARHDDATCMRGPELNTQAINISPFGVFVFSRETNDTE